MAEAPFGASRLNQECVMAMTDEFIKSHKTQKVMLPPKRGQVKVRIIRCFVKMVTKVVSKTDVYGRRKCREGN